MLPLAAALFLAAQDAQSAPTDAVPPPEPPERATCALAFTGMNDRDRRPDGVRVSCPGDTPYPARLQQVADATVGAIDLDIAREPAGTERLFARSAVFTLGEDDRWRPLPGQEIIVDQPAFPLGAVRAGLVHMMCAAAFEPDRAGRPRNIRTACINERRDDDRYMRNAMRESLEHFRSLPVEPEYCLYTQRYVQATIVTEGPRFEPPPAPNPERLPEDLCLREPD